MPTLLLQLPVQVELVRWISDMGTTYSSECETCGESFLIFSDENDYDVMYCPSCGNEVQVSVVDEDED